MERPFSNTGDTVWDSDAGQAVAVTERAIFNTGNSVRDSDAGKISTILKCITANNGDRLAVIGCRNYQIATGVFFAI